jgi:hypothetical protein
MDNVGSAFPVLAGYEKVFDSDKEYQRAHYEETGKTLRDDFAGQALAAVINGRGHFDGSGDKEYIAEWAYKIADAMIAERKKDGVQ